MRMEMELEMEMRIRDMGPCVLMGCARCIPQAWLNMTL